MKKFELREIGKDWSSDGELLSTHNNIDDANKHARLAAEKRVKKVYYMRNNMCPNGDVIVDYGLYNRFLKIKVVKNEEEN